MNRRYFLTETYHSQKNRSQRSADQRRQTIMFQPNLYTLIEKTDVYGLHKFRDGQIYLVQQHTASGDWQTLRPAKESEVRHFEKHAAVAVQRDSIS
jgi:hypothetical protein